MTITRRLALSSGLFYGLLAVAGCSGSSQETETPKIDGLSPGEYRDKMEIEALKAARTRGRSKAAREVGEEIAGFQESLPRSRQARGDLGGMKIGKADPRELPIEVGPNRIVILSRKPCRRFHFHARLFTPATRIARLHAHRTARRHRHHRRPDRPAPARGAGGPRGGPPRPVRQQPQAARPGRPQLRRREPVLPVGDVLHVPAGTSCPRWKQGPSFFISLLPFVESINGFNAYNANLHPFQSENSTVLGLGLSTLWCPSDPEVSQPIVTDQPAEHPRQLQRHRGRGLSPRPGSSSTRRTAAARGRSPSPPIGSRPASTRTIRR